MHKNANVSSELEYVQNNIMKISYIVFGHMEAYYQFWVRLPVAEETFPGDCEHG